MFRPLGLPSVKDDAAAAASGLESRGELDALDSLDELDALASCWDTEGKVDEAGRIVYRMLVGCTDPDDARSVIAALGHQLLTEDAQFHWYQILEASIRQFSAWPTGSEQGALIMAGAARFLAAHTPTRRELSHVVHIATRLRRGEPLYEEGEQTAEQEPESARV